MDLINKCISGWFILLVCAMPGDCLAQQKVAAPGDQRPPFYFDKPITLDSLTKFVHSHSAIRFSFNSSKVKGDKVINLKKGTYTIGLLLQEIRKNTSLYYRMYNGYVIFQDNPPKQRTRRRPVAKKKKPVHTPVRRTQPTDTTHIIKHTNPDSLNRVVAIDTPAAIDPVIAHHGVKDTTANNLLLTTMAGGTPGNNYIDVVDTIKGQTPKGKATPAPVPARNSNRPWVKDTMQTKTKMIRTDVSRKDGRIVARAFRAPWHWQFGLHWKVAIPVNGGGNYFTGPNNRSQPYNPLIPGIWLSRHNDQHEILLLVKPAEWTVYGNNVIKEDNSIRKYGPDTLPAFVPLRKTTSFIKSGGMYAGLQYNYHLNESFVIGAGIGYQTLGQTLGKQQTKRIVDSGTYGKNIPDTLFTVKGDSLTNRYLRASFILAKFEVAYKLGSVNLGAAVLLPLTSPFTSQSRDHSKPLNFQVFVRWRLKREENAF